MDHNLYIGFDMRKPLPGLFITGFEILNKIKFCLKLSLHVSACSILVMKTFIVENYSQFKFRLFALE